MENVVLALMAHPDDAEFLCGGTLVHLSRLGWKVHIATATPGDCGSSTLQPDEIAAVRRREGEASARRLGGAYHCLERRDLLVFYDEALVRAATGLLRQVRPRLVITHSPADYMLDHEQISMAARAAAFNAPIPNAPAAGTAPPLGAIPHLYYADPIEGKGPLGDAVLPSLLIDVTAVLDEKLALLAEHASQRDWLRSHHGIDEYLESARRWGRERGRLARVEQAEGFRQHRGHAYPQDDLLALTLRELATLILPARAAARAPRARRREPPAARK
jgi:LmbE family N-acetylglucosaminyl deacetylase